MYQVGNILYHHWINLFILIIEDSMVMPDAVNLRDHQGSVMKLREYTIVRLDVVLHVYFLISIHPAVCHL